MLLDQPGPIRLYLQWGHGSEAVETSLDPLKRAEILHLQWGHGSEAVETED